MDSKQQNSLRGGSWICVGLLVITLIAFWPAGHLGFVKYDDYGPKGYIVNNTNIQAGITFKSIYWAFTTAHASNWHPVTWLSHMLDYELFGLNASGHHWMNLGFHIANTLLLFLVLNRMMGLRRDDPQQPYDSPPRNANKTANAAIAATTPQAGLHQKEMAPAAAPPGSATPAGTVWRCAFVAALFALHPLHVQSVAWVSERKDVLSGFFMMLTLWAYVRYAQRQSKAEGRESSAGNGRLALDPRPWTLDYCLALLFFALGLMSKPMLVTLPVILLLLDFWPLGRVTCLHSVSARQAGDKWRVTRFGLPVPQLPGATKRSEGGSTFSRLLWEKAPFLALSLATCILTVWAHDKGRAVVPVDRLPFDLRMENCLVSYTAYLGKMFWPANLAVFYPYTRTPSWEILGAGLLLFFLSVFCLRRVRSQPYLLVGWLWFLAMLIPVIGLVQVGQQSIADRYTYLPSIGLFIILAWGIAGVASLSSLWRTAMTLGTAGLLLACLLVTRHQLSYWRNSITLFSHALEVTGENPLVNYYLGNALWDSGNPDEAAKNYRSLLRTVPDFEDAHYRLAYILLQQKKYEEAGVQFGEVVRLNYSNVDGHVGLGCALAAQGKCADAEAEYAIALQLKPGDPDIRGALMLTTQKAEAIKALANLYETLKTRPTPETCAQIAALETTQGKFQDALGHYLAALQLKPDSPDVLNNLAWLLATCPDAQLRNGAQAVGYAERACELTHHGVTPIVGTLAAAYAGAGRFDEAIATAQKACALAEKQGEQDLLKRNQELLALYLQHQPYHETTKP
jgi:tetratricopeptide (TPR) repeat protein